MARKILIIDDSQWVSDLLARALRDEGYEIVTCRNGNDGIDFFNREEPDLVILDILLPGTDGLELCKSIKKTARGMETPVFLISGIYKGEEFKAKTCSESGAQEYLEKPVHLSHLLDLIWKYLSPGPERFLAESVPTDVEIEKLSASGSETQTFDLKETFIAHLLYDFHCRRKTGVLLCRHEETTKIFYLAGGAVTFARSNCPEDRIGYLLTSSGLITEEQLANAMELHNESRGKSRVGNVLVAEGVITEDELKKAVLSQLISMILSVFEWESGTATFIASEPKPDEKIHLDIYTPALILAALQRASIPSWRIDGFLPDNRSLLRCREIPEEIVQRLNLTTFERQTLELVQDMKQLSEIDSIGSLSSLDIRRILFHLLSIGLIEVESGPAPLEIQPDPETRGKLPGKKKRIDYQEGTLRKTPFPALLASLFFSKKTGILTVESGDDKRWLHFENGDLIYARSNDPNERIGQILLSAQKITREDIDRAIELQSRSEQPVKIGTVLVKMRAVSLKEFHWAITFQAMRVIRSVFQWTDGCYIFEEEEIPQDEKVTLALNAMTLIMQCIREMEPAALEGWVPAGNAILMKKWDADDLIRVLNLTSLELKFLEMIRNGSTVQEVLNLQLLPKHDCLRTLYGFLTVGVVKVIGYRATVQKAVPAAEAVRGTPSIPVSIAGPIENDMEIPVESPAPAPIGEKEAATGTGKAAPDTVPRFLYDELLEERRSLEKELARYKEIVFRYREVLQAIENKKNVLRDSMISGSEHGEEYNRLFEFAVGFINDLSLRLEGIGTTPSMQ
jgi:CheY-like chemotaxis protein